MAVGDPSERTLEYTPAWALAAVSAVFIILSLIVERSLHVLGHVRTIYAFDLSADYVFDTRKPHSG